MREQTDVLQVQMLGGFHMTWNGKEIQLKSGNTTKAMQILQLLLYHAPERVASSALIAQIFAYDEILSPSNNLKASISLLRRQLSSSGLPSRDFIAFQENGYVWKCALPLSMDVHMFEAAAKKALGEGNAKEQLRLCREAADLYTGNFMPELLGVDWASPLSVYYGELYAKVQRRLAALLQEADEDVLPLTERAYSCLHTDEWQVLRMQVLMKLGRWDEAKQVYMDAVTTLSKEYDIEPSAELVSQYRIISSQLSNALGTFHDMLDNVRENEDDVGGAYFCTFPGFIDSCRVTARSMARSGLSCYLMLCSLCDGSGNALQNEERLLDASEKLRTAVQSSLRRSDFLTQYNKSQYLIFLLGTCRENCVIVQRRIENNFRAMSVRGVRLSYELSSAGLSEMEHYGESGLPSGWH